MLGVDGRAGHVRRLLDGRTAVPAPRPRIAAPRRAARADRRRRRASRTTSERDARRAADDALADEIERIGVERVPRRWLAQPLFAGLDRSRRRHRGPPDQHRDGLASSLRLAGTGTQAPLWARLGELAMPVLVRRRRARRQVHARSVGGWPTRSPTRRSSLIEGAGHAAHLERPDADLRGDRDVAPLPSTAERQPEREQRAVGELHPAGRAEHGDQGRAAGTVDHRPHRHGSDGDREHGQERRRLARPRRRPANANAPTTSPT